MVIIEKRRVAALLAAALGFGSLSAEESSIVVPPPGPIEEMVVLGKFIPDEKRDTSEISNVLDEDALSLLSDDSVGEALSRVTGLSLVGGKYVYVRGLGERYSSTLLNGTRISSPVPFQKTVPLDIVPNNIVRSLLVQKTFSAQYPGDFSGGLVDIGTKATPDENYLVLNLSIGGNSEITGGDGLTYHGGSRDWWGYDDGTRELPLNIQALSSEEFEDVPFPDSQGLGASFFNFWDVRERREVEPNLGGEAELGLRHEFDNGMAIGFLGSGKLSHDWSNRYKDFRRYEFSGVEDNPFTQTVQYDQHTTKEIIRISAFGNVGLELSPDHSISLTSVLLRLTEDEVQQNRGLSSEDDVGSGTYVESYRLQWVENEILTHQLSGQHFFPELNDARIGWRVVDGRSTRDSPDRRSYTYAENNDGLLEVVTPNRQAAGDLREVFQAPDRNFAELDDDLQEYGVDLELPLFLGEVDVTIRAGGSIYERKRESSDRLFRFDLNSQAPSYVALMTPSQLFDIPNWASGALDVRDFSAGAANASGIFPFGESKEETDAYYVAIDAQVTPRIRIQAGVRVEDTKLEADAFGGNTEQGANNFVSQNFKDTLPSGSVTWEFVNDMQVRLAASKTRNLPSLLEITGTTIRNPENSQLYRGNVFLEPATITNYDIRWEWYFGDADSMSLGAFQKDLRDPIEVAQVQAQNDIFTWFNGDEGELQGVEYEIRKDLYFGSWFGLSDGWNYFTLTANVSYIDSNVSLLADDETAADIPLTGGRNIRQLFQRERPLTGQSDWLGNVMLSYQNYDLGLESSLTYNYTGERVVLVGSRNAPDIIEESRGKLDFLLKYTLILFNSDVELEVKVTNIFDEEVRWTQGGNIYERYDEGVGYSFGVKVTI